MHKFSNREKANHFLHGVFCSRIEQTLKQRAYCSVAIPGGSTPLDLFRLLANRSLTVNEKIEWSRVKVFWVDERWVAHDNPDSNYLSAYNNWLSFLPEINAFPVRTDLTSLDASAVDYGNCLKNELGQDEMGNAYPLDLLLLGMGSDGHVASLFPGSEEMISDQCVIHTVQPVSQQKRISMTYEYISCAHHIVLPVFGQVKTDLLEKVLGGQCYLPISRVLGMASQVEIINSIE